MKSQSKKNRINPKYIWAVVILIVMSVISIYSLVLEDEKKRSTQDLNALFHRENNAVYEPVLPNTPVTLPNDFRFHPEYQQEWWRYVADLKDVNGKTYSVQWIFYRIATDERQDTGWRNPQLYNAQIVVTSGRDVWRQQRMARGGIGQAGFGAKPFRLWLDNWSWRSIGKAPLPGKLSVETDTFSVKLNSFSKGPYVLPGQGGYTQKHDLLPLASYSVQAPFISVMGELVLNGETIPVSGNGWLDKEWGSELLTQQLQASAMFTLKLNDSMSLSVQQVKLKNHVAYTYGTLATNSGFVASLSDSQISVKAEKEIPLRNGKVIPLVWSIKVPEFDIDVTIRPRMREQWHPFVIQYWEGAVEAINQTDISGFMQLTGY